MGTNIGRFGEEIAKKFLAGKGYTVIAQNYFAGRRGEIDLIATRGIEIVFVEVKTRTKLKYSAGLEAVDWYKLKRWYWAAEDFILKNPRYENHHWRFDVLEVYLIHSRRRANICWVRDVH